MWVGEIAWIEIIWSAEFMVLRTRTELCHACGWRLMSEVWKKHIGICLSLSNWNVSLDLASSWRGFPSFSNLRARILSTENLILCQSVNHLASPNTEPLLSSNTTHVTKLQRLSEPISSNLSNGIPYMREDGVVFNPNARPKSNSYNFNKHPFLIFKWVNFNCQVAPQSNLFLQYRTGSFFSPCIVLLSFRTNFMHPLVILLSRVRFQIVVGSLQNKICFVKASLVLRTLLAPVWVFEGGIAIEQVNWIYSSLSLSQSIFNCLTLLNDMFDCWRHKGPLIRIYNYVGIWRCSK